MQAQKKLYIINIDAVNKDIKKAVLDAYTEQFQISRSDYSTKYRAVDGILYKADDVKILLKKVEETVYDSDIRSLIQEMLLNLYAALYDICVRIDENKTDEITVHSLPKKFTSRSIPLFDEFIPEKVVPLIDYIKGVLKDSKNNVTFDNIIDIVTMFITTLENIDMVIKPDFDKSAESVPVLGSNFTFMVSDEASEEEEEKKEEPKAEPAEPLFFEPVADAEPDTQSGPKFDFGSLEEETAPNDTEAADFSEDTVSDFAASVDSAYEEAESAAETAVNEFEDVSSEEENINEEFEDAYKVYDDDSQNDIDDVDEDKIKYYADNVLKSLKEFENSRELIAGLKQSIEVNIKLPEATLGGTSQSLIDDIRKNINATIQNSLQPLYVKIEDDYTDTVNNVNILHNELNNLLKYLKDIKEDIGF